MAGKMDPLADLMQKFLSKNKVHERGNDLESALNHSKAHLDDEKKRRGKFTVLPDPNTMRMGHRLATVQISNAQHSFDKGTNVGMSNTVTHRITASKKPFSQLRRVSVVDLKLEMAAEGCYVILRMLEKGFAISGWSTIVEDHNGKVCGITIYNYPPSELFEIGTVVIVKEPYFKIVLSGDPYIRCDCPSDIIVLRKSHHLYDLATKIDWINDVDDYDAMMKNPAPKSAEKWKERGNNFFNIPDLVSAREAYLLGLKMCQEKNATWKLLKLNLAAAFLELGYYEDTISAVIEVLELFPGDKKALLRAGRAHYNLRQYNEAHNYFDKLRQLFPDDSECDKELNKTKDRLDEQAGNVNILRLSQQSLADPLKKLECADYVGPVKIAKVPGKGRGVVLTEDVEKDTLLIVSKAIASTLNPHETLGFEMFTNNSCDLNRRSAAVVSQIAEMLMKNPATFAPVVYDLSAGENPRVEVQMFCDPSTKNEPICDVGIVKSICRCNDFGLHSSDPKLNRWNVTGDGIGSGLFVFPSYINHSCVVNVHLKFVNDVMFVYSLKKMKAGDEILTSYVPLVASYEQRNKMLKQRGFTCRCRRCKSKS